MASESPAGAASASSGGSGSAASASSGGSAGWYDASRARILGLLEGAGEDDLARPVPATPGWSVQDLVAHLAGELGDFRAGRFAAQDGESPGDRRVRERRGASLAELLAEWEEDRAASDELIGGPVGGVLVAEIVAHEHDLRGGLDRPGARTDPSVRVAVERPLAEIAKRQADKGIPAVRLIVDGGPPDGYERLQGTGEATATLRISGFELLRAIGGRRSERQLRAYDWSGEPELGAFTLFGPPRDTDLEE